MRSRDSNSCLPCSKPTRYCLSHAAPFWATPPPSEPRCTLSDPRRSLNEPRRTLTVPRLQRSAILYRGTKAAISIMKTLFCSIKCLHQQHVVSCVNSTNIYEIQILFAGYHKPAKTGKNNMSFLTKRYIFAVLYCVTATRVVASVIFFTMSCEWLVSPSTLKYVLVLKCSF